MRHLPNSRLILVTAIGAVTVIAATTVGALTGRGSLEISQDTARIDGRAEDGDFSAAALATGDFNGDGFADVVVGAPNEDLRKNVDAGQIQVIYGTRRGLGTRDKIIHQGTKKVPADSLSGDLFGSAIAVADFDGDGFDDAAVGVPGKDIDGQVDAGSVVILYGRKKGLLGARSFSISQGEQSVGGLPGAYNRFGHSLTAGDFNGDGSPDLAIGVPGAAARAGGVSVVYGSAAGLNVATAMWISQQDESVGDSPEPDDRMGWSLAAGDFNADGSADLAVGVPGEAHAGQPGAGIVQVFSGSPEGIGLTDLLLSEDTPGVKGGVEARDAFGASLAVGDFDGDSNDDLAIGVPGESKGKKVSSGVVHVLRGSSTGLSGVGSKRLGQAGKAVRGDPDAGDEFGWALAVGDFNGNGRDDLAVGVPGERVGSANGAGSVQVFFGRSKGISKKGDQIWRPGSNGIPGRAEANAGVGRALSTGDIDGDGRDDLVVGSPGRTVTSDPAAGSFLVING